MAVLDTERDAVVIRIVYDGPPHAGKTTSVRSLARSLSRSVETPLEAEGRTLFFDWMEYTGGLFEGHQIRCQIVSVPGQPDFAARRRALLETADVVVFVADTSDRGAVVRSASHVREMVDILGAIAGPPVAVIVQANKRDLPTALPRAELAAAFGDDFRRAAVTESVAEAGVGIRETFVLAVRLALDRIRELMARGELPHGTPTANSAEQLLKQLEDLPADVPLAIGTAPVIAVEPPPPVVEPPPPVVQLHPLLIPPPPPVLEQPIEPVIEAPKPRARTSDDTHEDTVVFDTEQLSARAPTRRLRPGSKPGLVESSPEPGPEPDVLDVEQLMDAASTDDAWTLDAPAPAAQEIKIYDDRIADASHGHAITVVDDSDNTSDSDGIIAEKSPPQDTERLTGLATNGRPRLPDVRVPSGAIWPPVEGRLVLHEAATAGLVLHKVGNADWIAGMGTGWRIHSSGDDTYETFDQGREALLGWARLHSTHAELLSPTRCVVLAEAGGHTWRLWQIVKLLPSLRTWVVDGAELDAGELFARLSTAAMLLGEAHARTAQTRLPSTLDSIGRGPVGPQFVALMPHPNSGPAPRLSDITERIIRELSHLLTAELIERRPELATLVDSSEGWRTPWDDLVATAVLRD